MTQKEALEILKTGKNVFVTGPAGSGKTHLINTYIEYLRKHDIEAGITASTGIAATHMGGVTIHSWTGIGIASYLSEYDLEALAEKSYLSSRFERAKVLIIDEVSMLHHFRFDLVNQVLKAFKGNNKPFGGLQVVLCGDFFQLPPVSRMGEPESEFIYRSDAWHEGAFTVCYLTEQHRQKDDVALRILNEIRSGTVSADSRKLLEGRFHQTSALAMPPTRLFTHNADVDSLNYGELETLRSIEEAEYRMETRGREALAETLKKSCLAPEILKLKVGARVMCVKNNFEKGYVNGTLGIVISCKSNQPPRIRTVDGRILTIEHASWKIEEDGKVKAEIMQYPLRLAWAITVHKSQGMSLDAVEVDLSKSFEPGMGYVALSRVRSLLGLSILGLNETALRVRDDVLEFDSNLQELSEDAREHFGRLSVSQREHLQSEFLKSAKPPKKKAKLSPHEETLRLLSEKEDLGAIAKARGVTTETIISHIEKLLALGTAPDISYLKREIAPSHWKKIEQVINELSDDLQPGEELRLSPIKNKVGANISYLHIRLARALLGFGPKTF